MNDQKLSVPALRNAVNRLLDTVDAELGSEIAFDVDYYWSIPFTEAFLHQRPELVMGQVSDDVDSVHEFSRDRDGVVAIWHECEHIAGTLLAIAAHSFPTSKDQ